MGWAFWVGMGIPDALEGGGGKALADGAGNHEDQGHQVDLLPAKVVTADSKRHLQEAFLIKLCDKLQNLCRCTQLPGWISSYKTWRWWSQRCAAF